MGMNKILSIQTQNSTICTLDNRAEGLESKHADTKAGWGDSEESPHPASSSPVSRERPDLPQPDHHDEASYRPTNSFEAMGLSDPLLRGIFAAGFEKPTPIQQKGIPAILTGRDCILQAQSGQGKTATFAIALLNSIDTSERECQAIVLSPTRELAMQTSDIVAQLGSYLGVSCASLVGGRSIRDDISALQRGVQVVVATPGRALHMLSIGKLRMERLRILVLDEADEMLSLGFQDQIRDMFEKIPSRTQVALLSATMPEEALMVSENFMQNPIRVLVKAEMLTLDGIKQFYVYVGRDDMKLETLLDLYETISVSQSIIFCSTRRRAQDLADEMDAKDFGVSLIHADLNPQERTQVVKDFRNGASRVLISTDVLSRGLDVQAVSVVINFDLPNRPEPYLHRIGRSGRHGKKGVAINLIAERDVRTLRDVEQFYGTQIAEMPSNVADYF